MRGTHSEQKQFPELRSACHPERTREGSGVGCERQIVRGPSRRMTRYRIAHVSLVIAGMVLGATTLVLGAEPAKRESYADHYGPLSEHNIFAKDRPIKKASATSQPTTAIPRTPEESLVLRGVALDSDGSIRAYVEDLDNSRMLKLSLGDAVGRGKIAALDIDAVDYERNGEQVWIEAGADFTGRQVIAITSDSTGPSGSPTTGPTEIIDPNDPNLTIEQKLKLRRLHPELFK
jgi:hypothetical protein